MTPATLRSAIIRRFGKQRGYMTRAAEALHTDVSNISKWLAGKSPIPGPVEAAVECWEKHYRAKG